MNITLTPHGKHLLQRQLARGSYLSPEEVIERALETLAERDSYPFRAGASRKSPAEAVADILQLRQGVRLGGSRSKT